MFRSVNSCGYVAYTDLMMGIMYSERGEFDEAADHLEQALTFAQSLGDRRWEAYGLLNLAVAAQGRGLRTRRAETSNDPWTCSSKPATVKEPVLPVKCSPASAKPWCVAHEEGAEDGLDVCRPSSFRRGLFDQPGDDRGLVPLRPLGSIVDRVHIGVRE